MSGHQLTILFRISSPVALLCGCPLLETFCVPFVLDSSQLSLWNEVLPIFGSSVQLVINDLWETPLTSPRELLVNGIFMGRIPCIYGLSIKNNIDIELYIYIYIYDLNSLNIIKY
jgi:hypothetical protein